MCVTARMWLGRPPVCIPCLSDQPDSSQSPTLCPLCQQRQLAVGILDVHGSCEGVEVSRSRLSHIQLPSGPDIPAEWYR